jgi:hypothetical protein
VVSRTEGELDVAQARAILDRKPVDEEPLDDVAPRPDAPGPLVPVTP